MAGQLVENKGDAGPALSVEGMQGSHCSLSLSLAGQLVESRGNAGFPLLVEGMQGSHCW